MNTSNIVFHTQILETVNFNVLYHGYCISSLDLHKIVPVADLYSPFPMHIYNILTAGVIKHIIVPKFHICGCVH